MPTDSTHTAANDTGTFDHSALASARRFDARDFVEDRSILGLVREGGYLWGTLRDSDGVLYTTMRRFAATEPEARKDNRQSLAGKLIVLSNDTGDGGLGLRREPRGAADSADIVAELTDGNSATLSSPATAAGRPMRLVLSEQDFSYTEEEVIDVTGRIVVPPLQWYLPGRDASLLYFTQTWLVDGTLLGKPVRGFLFWEEAWMYPGGRLYMDKDPLHDARYLTWYSWANHYDDGSTEVGHYLFGQDNFHVGVSATSDGAVSVAREMNVEISRAADGYWHDGIDYELDGVKWRCDPDPHGQMRGLGTSMPNPQQEGFMHRVDDTRRPEVYMAWGETVPAAGNHRVR